MNKATNPYRKPLTHVFFFALFLVLLSWPLMTVADRDSPLYTMPVYLFVLWLLMIGVIFVLGRNCRKKLASCKEEKQEMGEY